MVWVWWNNASAWKARRKKRCFVQLNWSTLFNYTLKIRPNKMHTIPRIPLISLTSRIAALDDADQKKKKKMLRWMEHKLWIRVGVVMTVQKNSKQQTNGKRKCFITHQLIAIENWVRSIMIIIVLPFLFYIFSVRCDFCSSSPSVRRQNCAIRVNTKKKKRTWKIEFIKLSWRIAEQQ